MGQTPSLLVQVVAVKVTGLVDQVDSDARSGQLTAVDVPLDGPRPDGNFQGQAADNALSSDADLQVFDGKLLHDENRKYMPV